MYQRADDKIKGSVDWFTIIIYATMVIFGWFSIYGATYQYEENNTLLGIPNRAEMQLVWIGTSAIIAFILLKLDSNIYDILAYYIYIFFIFLLLLTIFVAPDIKGSQSWIVITPTMRFQPAEFSKFAVALALAKYMSGYGFKLMKLESLLTIFAIIALPILLIRLQNETGSAIVFSILILVLYREGLPGIILILLFALILFFVVALTSGILAISLLIPIFCIGFIIGYTLDLSVVRNILGFNIILFGFSFLFNSIWNLDLNWMIISAISLGSLVIYLLYLAKKYWSKTYLLIATFAILGVVYASSVNYIFFNSKLLEAHQQKRIKVVLGLEEDLSGAGYNVNQSTIAIGSGGFFGKGFLNGTQTKLKYVPEQDTDFIFCTVGEEQGFVGSIFVILLFTTLIFRLFYLAERQRSAFGRVYGYSVACIFLFHFAINIGMVIGLAPVIGIPLPFFSYGGSSLWAFTILLFIFLRIDMTRKRR